MMGSSERLQNHHTEEEVDLDADTKESTEELFCNEETAESPHKIILSYSSQTPKVIGDHFPRNSIHRQIGREVTLGRNKVADVLLYDKHMARNFATVTCRTTTTQKISFVLRNACDATKQKRIVFTDSKGHVTDLLPTQEVELLEQTTFKLETVEFKVGIELGDLNSKSFELEVKPVMGAEGGSDDRPANLESVHRTSSVSGALQAVPSLESAYIGLPLTSNASSGMNSVDQVIPKHVASPLMSQSYGPGLGVTAGAGVPVTQVISPQYQTGFHPLVHHHNSNPYQQQYGYGYCDIQQPRSFISQPPAMHAYFVHQGYNPASGTQPQLLERGSGYPSQPHSPNQPCSCHQHGHVHDHHKATQGMHMGELAQALPDTRVTSVPVFSPRGIVTTPSTHDQSPVLYPSPANQKFRFPQPQAPSMLSIDGATGRTPDLSDLPRGPPLASLNSGQSINLHPHIPASVITAHAVCETGQSHAINTKIPVEHEDKPK